ncbi:hypothetical protein AYO20_07343 [Fonsecaea nubica]|uniref:BZIP domain-containing protein n=1 Tax=Fonsecaea nubica TaxID=856822 RepID=A0A178CVW2_9EURO|nr:hypothetical protein AYO20_07343 [Fonsecaea nubica]OAL33332.1 hypothetical protein AYO20_07343 [Fonsecaea nubica]
MDYFAVAAAHRGSYFESLVDAGSSNSSSPDVRLPKAGPALGASSCAVAAEILTLCSSTQNMGDVFRYGGLEPGMFPPSHGWSQADLDTLDAFAEFKPQTARQGSAQPSTDSEQTIVPPSKLVRDIFSNEPRLHANEQGQRRRAQNRASQRAFRERKEKHVKGLEYQLETLNEKHQDLLCSYNKQSDSIIRLNTKIAQLQADLEALRFSATMTEPPTSHSHYRHKWNGPKTTPPDKFDAFPNPVAHPVPVLYDGYELGPDGTIVSTVENQNAAQATKKKRRLPDFEDLLRMG